MIIEFLVSTCNRTDGRFLEHIFGEVNLDDCRVLVINQCFDIPVPVSMPEHHPHVRILSYDERGLSRSRNRALENASGDICVITDDDVQYTADVLRDIRTAYRTDPGAGIITFMVDQEGHAHSKSYAEEPFRHSMKSLWFVSSVEITFRLNSIREGHIKFDERFGIGADFGLGEEGIFLRDAMKSGIICSFAPRQIVAHPDESTGARFHRALIRARGAKIIRYWGLKGIVLLPYSAWKSSLRFKKSFILLLWHTASGACRYILRMKA